MATVHYTAKVKASRLLELPEEAQSLGLQPGAEVKISLDAIEIGQPVAPNEQALAALREIARLQEGMKPTSGEDTDRRLREARAGGLYGLTPTQLSARLR